MGPVNYDLNSKGTSITIQAYTYPEARSPCKMLVPWPALARRDRARTPSQPLPAAGESSCLSAGCTGLNYDQFQSAIGLNWGPYRTLQHRNFSEIQTRFSCIVFHYRLDLVRPRNSDRWFYLQLDKVGKAMILSSRTCTAVSLLEACSSCPAGRLSLPGAARRGRDQK